MVKYELTKKAVEDLTGIWEYTLEKWSEEQADKYFNLLLNTCQDIANNPDIGKNYDGVSEDLLGLKIEKHIVFYRKRINQPIEITRILHEKMDFEKRLNK